MKIVLFMLCFLLAEQSFASALLQTKDLNCQISTQTGQTELAVIRRKLWKHPGGSVSESRSFSAGEKLKQIFAADYGKKIIWNIGAMSSGLSLPLGTVALAPLSGILTENVSITYLGEANSRLEVKSQMTTSFRPNGSDTTAIDITIEDVGFYGDPNEFISLYKKEFNLDIAPSTFVLKKIHYTGTCSEK